MYHDVSKLRDFYYRSALGRSVQKRLQIASRKLWPDLKDQVLLGYGFASPILRPFLSEVSHLTNLMPADQGVMAWPPSEPNTSALCLEGSWPLGASSVDRLIVLHALENANSVSAVLNEFWRVLTPEGRAILIIPNRLGIWSTSEKTPFGFGRTFSMSQLDIVLHAHQFKMTKKEGALYGSPWRSVYGLRTSNAMEWVAERAPSKFLAGVWLIEIEKYASPPAKRITKKDPIFATPDLRPAGAMRRDRYER